MEGTVIVVLIAFVIYVSVDYANTVSNEKQIVELKTIVMELVNENLKVVEDNMMFRDKLTELTEVLKDEKND